MCDEGLPADGIEKSHVVAIKLANVGDAVSPHAEPFDAETEGEPGIDFGIVADGGQHVRIDHAGASATVSVCVIRRNFARVGAKVTVVCAPSPLPSATGLLHVVPSVDTCTA